MKHAIVTGGARGIGKGIAQALRLEGWQVVAAGSGARDEADYIRCDISKAADRENLVRRALAERGPIDLLVNCAGVAPLVRCDLLEMTEESFDRVMNVNLKGTFFLTQLVARSMLERMGAPGGAYKPRIVNIGSISAYTSSVSRGEYCMSKAGVAMATMLFADRLAEAGIPVFEVRPGIIDTDMTRPVHEKYQRLIEEGLLPVQRFGRVEDVANMVLACASGLLDYSAGQVLDADGGFRLRRL